MAQNNKINSNIVKILLKTLKIPRLFPDKNIIKIVSINPIIINIIIESVICITKNIFEKIIFNIIESIIVIKIVKTVIPIFTYLKIVIYNNKTNRLLFSITNN